MISKMVKIENISVGVAGELVTELVGDPAEPAAPNETILETSLSFAEPQSI